MLHNDDGLDRTDAAAKAAATVRAFREWTAQWHQQEGTFAADDLMGQLHWANFTLWHLEDQARDRHASDTAIAALKRSIDAANQQRNDTVEQFDQTLLTHFASADLPCMTAPLHSETPGMMLDRLSILALKIFHTAEQSVRVDAPAAHRERNTQRLHVLQQQSDDLAGCLDALLHDVTHGRRSYRLYRQLKMYNDPDLNPVLYSSLSRGRSNAPA